MRVLYGCDTNMGKLCGCKDAESHLTRRSVAPRIWMKSPLRTTRNLPRFERPFTDPMILKTLRALAAQETPAQRRCRTVPGALYGLGMAAIYTLIGATVNQLSYPDIPVAIDGPGLFFTWLLFSAWLGSGGWLVNWFTYTEDGLTYSVPVMIAGALLAGTLYTDGSLLAKMSASVFLILILPGYSLFITIILRSLGARHADLLERGDRTTKLRGFAGLILTVVLLGALPGIGLTRWNDHTVNAARAIQTRLQNAAAEPEKLDGIFPLANVPGLAQRLQTPYTLRARPSAESVVAFDVTVDFNDGYQMTCVLLVFSEEPPFLRACAEGATVVLPAP
jgi:hypothetical protein